MTEDTWSRGADCSRGREAVRLRFIGLHTLVALARNMNPSCFCSQEPGPDQDAGRGKAATLPPPCLVRGARWRRPARGTSLRDLASLELKYTSIFGHVSTATLV